MGPDGVTSVEWVDGKARHLGYGVYAAPSPNEPNTIILRTDRGNDIAKPAVPHVIALEKDELAELAKYLRVCFPDLRIKGFAYDNE